MEFLSMSRYKNVEIREFPLFETLRTMKPVIMTMDLKVWDNKDNLIYLESLAGQGVAIFPIRRISTVASKKRSDFPSRVLFEMTSICNTKCYMCPQMNLKRKLMYMDKEKYKKVLDELDLYGIDGLWLYHFGESLTHPNFLEIINYAKTKQNLGYQWLSTNGILLNESVAEVLLNSSLSFLNFSLQSITKDNYKKIAPSSPAETIFDNLNKLINKKKTTLGIKPFLRLQIIEQEYTIHEIDQYLQQFYDKCDLISVNMLEHTDLTFNQKSKGFRIREKRNKCGRISRSDCFINSDGSVAICDNAYNNQLDIGNVWEKDLYDIWNGEERSRLLRMNDTSEIWNVPICSECNDYDL